MFLCLAIIILFINFLHQFIYGPKLWVDSIFHIAYAESFNFINGYDEWFNNRGGYFYFHEGLGFTLLWELSNIFGIKYSWLLFSFIQHTVFSFSILFFLFSLRILNQNKLIEFFLGLILIILFCSNLYFGFFNSSFMTESIAISFLIFSLSTSLIFSVSSNPRFWTYTFVMLIFLLIVSQMRIYWGAFIVIFYFYGMFKKESLISYKTLLFIFISLSFLFINSLNAYINIKETYFTVSGPSKLVNLSRYTPNSEELYPSDKISEILSQKGIPIEEDFSQTSFHSIFSNYDSATELINFWISQGMSIKEINVLCNDIIDLLYENRAFMNHINQLKINMFLNSNGLTFIRSHVNHETNRNEFIGYYNYLSNGDSKVLTHDRAKSWFIFGEIWDIFESRDKNFKAIDPWFYGSKWYNSNECSKYCRIIKHLYIEDGRVKHEIIAILGLISLIFLLYFDKYLTLSFTSILIINGFISQANLLSDARIMVPSYIVYILAFVIFSGYLMNTIMRALNKNVS